MRREPINTYFRAGTCVVIEYVFDLLESRSCRLNVNLAYLILT